MSEAEGALLGGSPVPVCLSNEPAPFFSSRAQLSDMVAVDNLQDTAKIGGVGADVGGVGGVGAGGVGAVVQRRGGS